MAMSLDEFDARKAAERAGRAPGDRNFLATQMGESGERARAMGSDLFVTGSGLVQRFLQDQERAAPTMRDVGVGVAPGTERTGTGIGQGVPSIEAEGAQRDLIRRLQLQAEGRGPSLAEAEAERGRGAAVRGALALASRARGGNIGAAMRGAQNVGAQAAQAATSQAIRGRLAEQAQAQGLLQGVTRDVTALDLERESRRAEINKDLAMTDAEIAAKYGLKQADIDLARAQGDLDAVFKQQEADRLRRLMFLEAGLKAQGLGAQTETGVFGTSGPSRSFGDKLIDATLETGSRYLGGGSRGGGGGGG
jgi:hypothetical protein